MTKIHPQPAAEPSVNGTVKIMQERVKELEGKLAAANDQLSWEKCWGIKPTGEMYLTKRMEAEAEALSLRAQLAAVEGWIEKIPDGSRKPQYFGYAADGSLAVMPSRHHAMYVFASEADAMARALTGCRDEIGSLRAQLAEAQVDTRRLDWLEEQRDAKYQSVLIEYDIDGLTICQINFSQGGYEDDGRFYEEDDFRTAIDAAMQAGEGES